DQFDRDDLARIVRAFLPERDHTVLDGDEVAVAKIACRTVAARSSFIGGVELDKTVAAIAQQRQRQQTHLVLKLTLDVGHDLGAIRVVVQGRVRSGSRARCASGLWSALTEEVDFCAKCREAFVTVGILASAKMVAGPEDTQPKPRAG